MRGTNYAEEILLRSCRHLIVSVHFPWQRKYLLYSDDFEVTEPDEQETIDKIIQAMIKGVELTREKYGKSVRTSHAKAHGLIRDKLHVLENLSDYLRQGLFAQAKEYDVTARLSHVPGELDDDRKVSGPRGFSFKVLGVEGPKLPVHEGEATQDFLLDTGKIFNALGQQLCAGSFFLVIRFFILWARRTSVKCQSATAITSQGSA